MNRKALILALKVTAVMGAPTVAWIWFELPFRPIAWIGLLGLAGMAALIYVAETRGDQRRPNRSDR